MNNKQVSFRYDDDTEEMLQEIIYYIQTGTKGLGIVVNRSDAIRFAIKTITERIRNEREGPQE